MKTLLLAGMVSLAGVAPALATDWQPVAQKCAANVEARYDCGADGYVCWTKIFECTLAVALPDTPPEKVTDCEQQINAAHPRSSDDPVKMAMECVMR